MSRSQLYIEAGRGALVQAPIVLRTPVGLSTAPPAAYEGFVATRGLMGADAIISGGYEQALIKSFHYARDDISSLKLLFADFYSSSETASGATTTISASIEYNGTRTRVTFSASNDGSLASGSTLLSDEISLPETIPAGAKFFIHQFKRNPNGYIYSQYQLRNSAGGDLVQLAASGLTDTVMTADPTNNNDAIHTPAVIAMTTKPSVLVLGDSKNQGVGGPAGGNANGDAGETARTIGKTYGYLNAAIAGERSYDTFTKRLAFAQYASHIISNHGINDVRASRTLAQTQRSVSALWTRFLGLDGQIDPSGGSVVNSTAFFFGLTATPSGADTLQSAFIELSASGDFKLVMVNSSNQVTFDEDYSGVAGVNEIALDLPVVAGDRLYYKYISGGGLVYGGGGSSHYFDAADYSGTLGDTVTQIGGNSTNLSMALRYASHVRKMLHVTVAPSEVSGSPEATNGVRVSVNDWLRTTPPMLEAYAELADVVEDPDDSGIWVPTYTTDLIHENATGYQAIEDADIFPTLTR